MSTPIGNPVIEALNDLTYAISEAGVPATRDPDVFQPPAAIVTAPSFVGGTLGGLVATVPVYFVTPDLGLAGLDEMIEMWSLAYPALGTRTAVPTLWVSPLNPDGLPAFLVSVTLTIEG